MSARAVTLALAGKLTHGRETAEEAGYLAERLHYPVGHAAALEARGTTHEDPTEGVELLREARKLWQGLSRPLDAAACCLLIGKVLRDVDPDGSARALASAAESFEGLGVAHMTNYAREMAAH
jgi:hypothetical protein